MCSAAKTKNTIDETANIPPKLDGVYYMIQVRKSSDTNGTNVKLLRFSFRLQTMSSESFICTHSL